MKFVILGCGSSLGSPWITNYKGKLKNNPKNIILTKEDNKLVISLDELLKDDLEKISEVDWIIEVVIENLEIKNQVFSEIEKHRKPGTIVTSNTSGIPIKFMNNNRSEDFQQHFAVTHFFNPPRYLKLLEIIKSNDVDVNIVDKIIFYFR